MGRMWQRRWYPGLPEELVPHGVWVTWRWQPHSHQGEGVWGRGVLSKELTWQVGGMAGRPACLRRVSRGWEGAGLWAVDKGRLWDGSHQTVQSRGGMSSDVGVKKFLWWSLEGWQKKQLGVLVKLRRQKCGLSLGYQFLELPYHSTTSWVTAGVYHLPLLEAKSPKSRCWQSCALPEGSRGESFPPASGVHGPSLVFLGFQLQRCGLCLWCHMAVFPVSVFCSHSDIGLTGFRVTLLQCDLILTWLHLQWPCIQIRSCSQVSCLSTSFWGGGTIQSTTPSMVGGGVEISEKCSDLVVVRCCTPWLVCLWVSSPLSLTSDCSTGPWSDP